MYKITKTIGDTKTIVLVFDDIIQAQPVFNELRHDEFVRFKRLYDCKINKEIVERKVDSDIVYEKYTISVPTFSVTIALEYTEN